MASLPFTKWQLRIRTENTAGHSAWSDQLVVHTPEGVPGPVRNVQATPQGPDRIKVTWEPPRDPNGQISGYVLSYLAKSSSDCDSSNSNQFGAPVQVWVQGEKHVLKDLVPATSYEITIRAKTTQEGPASNPVLAKTDEMGN